MLQHIHRAMGVLPSSFALEYKWILWYREHCFLQYSQWVVEVLVWRYIVHSRAVQA